MKYIFVLLSFILFVFPHAILAQSSPPPDSFYKATVTEILEEEEKDIVGTKQLYQRLKLTISGKGEEVIVEHGGFFTVTPEQRASVGEIVILVKTTDSNGDTFYLVSDKYRLDGLKWAIGLFAVMILLMSRWRGLGSLIGLGISLLVIVSFIVPNVLKGNDPVVVTIIGGLLTTIPTMYLAHGFSRRTSVSLVATIITLIIAGIISTLLVWLGKLSGLGSEEAYSLRLGYEQINYHGLLLAGMIIGALGVLDDVTTSQVAAVYELADTDKKLSMSKLFGKGMTIGQEHISSLVNTLVLAYAGASLPIFIFFVINPAQQPLWVILNSEFVAEEVIRTLSGSMSLALGVPIATIAAAWAISRRKKS